MSSLFRLRSLEAVSAEFPLDLDWSKPFTPAEPGKPAEPAPSGVALRLEAVGKSFGDKPVLQGIDLHVPSGQFLVVVGKSGCGKSTLLRLLVGLDQPTGGTIAIDRKPDGSKANTRILFQEPRLLPWAKVADNVAVGLGPRIGDRATVRQAAIDALADVHLHGRADDWPSVLSGGQRQRVALARALVSRPDLLVLDEPLGALDALTRITMQTLVERVWHAQGFTAVLVTHDVTEAVALGDRVIVIDEGRIILDLAIDLPRPRERGSAGLAALEGRLLDAIFGVDQPHRGEGGDARSDGAPLRSRGSPAGVSNAEGAGDFRRGVEGA